MWECDGAAKSKNLFLAGFALHGIARKAGQFHE
jgi:hypothetical protein